jgi:hypothetical protein
MTYEKSPKEVSECTDLEHAEYENLPQDPYRPCEHSYLTQIHPNVIGYREPEKVRYGITFGGKEVEEKGNEKSRPDYSLPAYITRANLRNPNDPSLPSFLEACKVGGRELVKNLAQTRDRADGSLTLGLTKAAEADNVAVVLYLLESGARWDAYTLQGAKSIEVFEVLFNHGFTMNDNLPQSSVLLTYVGYTSFSCS